MIILKRLNLLNINYFKNINNIINNSTQVNNIKLILSKLSNFNKTNKILIYILNNRD